MKYLLNILLLSVIYITYNFYSMEGVYAMDFNSLEHIGGGTTFDKSAKMYIWSIEQAKKDAISYIPAISSDTWATQVSTNITGNTITFDMLLNKGNTIQGKLTLHNNLLFSSPCDEIYTSSTRGKMIAVQLLLNEQGINLYESKHFFRLDDQNSVDSVQELWTEDRIKKHWDWLRSTRKNVIEGYDNKDSTGWKTKLENSVKKSLKEEISKAVNKSNPFIKK